MERIPVPDVRFLSLQIDVVGPLPPSEGMTYLLSIWDRTTRWWEAVPMQEATAKSSCDAFLRGWVQRFGLPQVVTSDNGNTFISKMWQEMHKTLGSEVSFTPPYLSQALGGSNNSIWT